MEHEVYDYFFTAEDAHWWFRARRRILASFLAGHFRRGGLRVADFGCGTGGMLGALAEYGEVTGVDAAPEAREYCARRGFPRVLTPEAWRASDQRYDLITAFDVIEHVDDDVALLGGMVERLAPEGRVLATVPAYPFLWSVFDEMNHHRRRYTRKRLAGSFRAAGLRVERATYFNTLLFPPVAAVRLVEKGLRLDPASDADKRKALSRWFKVGPLNGTLEAVFASERHWLAHAGFPFGTSILMMGRVAGS